MSAPIHFGVALGSNLGDRLSRLRTAADWLEEISEAPLLCSHIYETAAIDCEPGTPSFLNAVCELTSLEEPMALLRMMREFERAQGRPAEYPRNAPRSLDLDLLYADDLVFQTPELTLPHPRMTLRRFVLLPLSEIRPDLVLPGFELSVTNLLSKLEQAETVRLPPGSKLRFVTKEPKK